MPDICDFICQLQHIRITGTDSKLYSAQHIGIRAIK